MPNRLFSLMIELYEGISAFGLDNSTKSKEMIALKKKKKKNKEIM